jgi:mannan endo-1,6-alpha-mannosidase
LGDPLSNINFSFFFIHLDFFFLSKNKEGTFSETQTPWHESGMIWDMHFDYARWSGDTQFLPTVTQALFHQSRGNAQ